MHDDPGDYAAREHLVDVDPAAAAALVDHLERRVCTRTPHYGCEHLDHRDDTRTVLVADVDPDVCYHCTGGRHYACDGPGDCGCAGGCATR